MSFAMYKCLRDLILSRFYSVYVYTLDIYTLMYSEIFYYKCSYHIKTRP